MNQFKNIIFDWDGTLMDSAARIVSSMRTAACNLNMNIPSEMAVKHIIGLSLDHAFEALFPGCHSEQKKALFEEYRFQYVEGAQPPSLLFDGVVDLLSHLRASDRKLAVATGKGRGGLQRVFSETQVEHFFVDSICADEALSKPHPQMIHRLLERNGWDVSECLMIGDTTHDLAMAKNAGIAAVGVSYGAHDHALLCTHDPIMIVDSIVQLRKLFDGSGLTFQ